MGQRSLEAFLEDALSGINPTSKHIARVTVDPDYGATPDDSDSRGLAKELIQCIRQATPDSGAMNSPQGSDVRINEDYPLIKKYIRTITLHNIAATGQWVQVMPSSEPF